MPTSGSETIAIVGGGITGLFCAYVLAGQKKQVYLFEASKRYGGRIRTVRLGKNNKTLRKAWKAESLEFYAEFGPMRLELDKQLLLKALLTFLRIEEPSNGVQRNKHYLIDFPEYVSPTSVHDQRYELLPAEQGKTPLELLHMAFLRIMTRIEVKQERGVRVAFPAFQHTLVKQIELAAAIKEPVEPLFLRWMKELKPNHLWEIQTRGKVDGIPLHAMGFWNLLSDYLSHDAIAKVRDLGTFYHLLPENPNAAEWLVWWLVGLSSSERLHGIFGGMEGIVDRLMRHLKRPHLIKNCWVTALNKSDSKVTLIFDDNHQPEQRHIDREYDRVILALPRRAVKRIVRRSKSAFEHEAKILELLDSAFGFPMVKMFVVVKNRWWQEDYRPNLYATRVATRELHYWKGHTKGSKQGLIMAYTDRPASAFWANYVPPGRQTDAAYTGSAHPLPKQLEGSLKKKVAQYIQENGLPEITPEDIVWYGIRDWGRAPYGGANHAWRPGRKYWVVMRRLADIRRENFATSTPSIHICGEAYSDYHGFMEGSLRSAVYVLHRILDKGVGEKFETLKWVKATGLRIDSDYLDALRQWVGYLDGIKKTDGYLYGWADGQD